MAAAGAPASKPALKLKGLGGSVKYLTGVFSCEKFIQRWGNSACAAIRVDWLPVGAVCFVYFFALPTYNYNE
ncbi:MAG: hypothetical protein JW999_06930 [Methanotrichaceae archaeon]|nr:hypothetical protein [Methanotrichaceae archaeon]